METTLHGFLAYFLAKGDLLLAATLLWPRTLFDPRPESVRRIWHALETQRRMIILPGASSMGKSYSPGAWMLLQWYRDPEDTQCIAVGPSEEHLQSNLFSHLVRMHQQAAIQMPGLVQELFIGLDPRNRKAAIRGVVMPRGRQKGAGKLQGGKRYQRRTPHPVFGAMSRLFILVDELENVPEGIYPDLANLASALMDANDDGVRVIASYNPKDVTLTPYQLTDPPQGWGKIDPDSDYEWVSKRGNYVVRLDAKTSENVVTGEVLFLGLMTASGFAETVSRGGGEGSSDYWTFCRGMYPPQGSATSIVPPALISKAHGEPLWIDKPESWAGVDVALEGGDKARLAHGLTGLAREVRLPDGKVLLFRDPAGNPATRRVTQFIGIIPIARGDTVATATEVRRYAVALSVPPELLTVDRTGNGAGVHDLLKGVYGPSVRGVNYSSAATNTRLVSHDSEDCHDRFGDIATEMYSAVRYGLEYGYLFFHPGFAIDGSELAHQLGTRQTKPGGVKLTVESKKDFKKRQNKSVGNSPDDADSLTLGFDGIRRQYDLTFDPTKPDGSEVRVAGVGRADAGFNGMPAGPATDYVNDNTVDDLDDAGDPDGGGLPAGFSW